MNAPSTSEQTAVAAAVNVFVNVPETTLSNGTVVPAFQVGQYHCSKDQDGNAVIDPSLAPWVEIDYADARAACSAAGTSLITETQALALAWNAYNVAENWSGGAVGEGMLLQGLRDADDLDEPPAGTYVHPNPDQRRGFKLSNGETVYDIAGQVFSWVFDDVQGDENGIVAKAIEADSPSIAIAPHPSMEKGMGWRPRAGADWSGGALIRGGYWCSGESAGVFDLRSGWPDGESDYVGFRCTKPAGV